jgi:hypothetical protein
LGLLQTPGIAVAVALCTLCFFGDGAIEGYAALFLRDVLASGLVVTGAAVAAAVPAAAAVGLLVVGFALAPVVPTALSLAGRSAPGRSATAVSLVTTVGYSAFVAGPPIVGALASVTSLRTALLPVVASTAAIALLARRVRRAPLTPA